jgi:hypothetical protein
MRHAGSRSIDDDGIHLPGHLSVACSAERRGKEGVIKSVSAFKLGDMTSDACFDRDHPKGEEHRGL